MVLTAALPWVGCRITFDNTQDDVCARDMVDSLSLVWILMHPSILIVSPKYCVTSGFEDTLLFLDYKSDD